MDKTTLLWLLRSVQVEIILMFALILIYRKNLRASPWAMRAVFTLLALVVITLAVTFFYSYNNGMISSESRHSINIVPVWLVSIILALVLYKKMRGLKKYRDSDKFSQSGNYRFLYFLAVFTAYLIPILPLGIYIKELRPYFTLVIVPLFFVTFSLNVIGEYMITRSNQV